MQGRAVTSPTGKGPSNEASKQTIHPSCALSLTLGAGSFQDRKNSPLQQVPSLAWPPLPSPALPQQWGLTTVSCPGLGVQGPYYEDKGPPGLSSHLWRKRSAHYQAGSQSPLPTQTSCRADGLAPGSTYAPCQDTTPILTVIPQTRGA